MHSFIRFIFCNHRYTDRIYLLEKGKIFFPLVNVHKKLKVDYNFYFDISEMIQKNIIQNFLN